VFAVTPGIETVHEKLMYEGPRFAVVRGTYRHEDGEEVERQWVRSPAAVAMAAYDDDHVYLVRQPREAIGRSDVLEVPAGMMDEDGETPIETAKRELAEELGMAADVWVQATSMWASIGLSNELVHVFLATGLTKVDQPEADDSAHIDVVKWPLSDLDGLIDGLADSKTLVALLWLRRARVLGGTAGTYPPGE
jgi:ADP-ribose pyrophosphatase